MIKFFIIIFFLFSKVSLAQINVNSIIKLKENIPEECGLSFTINKDNNLVEAKVSIKKLENQDTITEFAVNSKKIFSSNIIFPFC